MHTVIKVPSVGKVKQMQIPLWSWKKWPSGGVISVFPSHPVYMSIADLRKACDLVFLDILYCESIQSFLIKQTFCRLPESLFLVKTSLDFTDLIANNSLQHKINCSYYYLLTYYEYVKQVLYQNTTWIM